MSSQNPVFIHGPTDIPERLRHAVNAPTIDHCSASFGEKFRPLFPGIKDVLETKTDVRSDVAVAQEYYRDTASALSEAA
jgi:aspartate aminotransferase-like enzyme